MEGTPSSMATPDGRKKRKRVTRACDECKLLISEDIKEKVFAEVANDVVS